MRFLILLVLTLIFSGCASMKDIDPAEDLGTRSDTFSEAMRWKDFEGAARYLTADAKEEFLEQFTEDDKLHIVDSIIKKLEISDELDSADAEYVMEYYRLPSSRVKKWSWTQQWTLIEKEEKTWQIENAPPQLPWKK